MDGLNQFPSLSVKNFTKIYMTMLQKGAQTLDHVKSLDMMCKSSFETLSVLMKTFMAISLSMLAKFV